jgi:sigma-54-specific transcriptional regulator
LLICKNGKVTAADLHLNPDFGMLYGSASLVVGATSSLKSLEHALAALYEQPADNLFDTIEEAIIRTAYEYCESNQVQTGRLLGISRNILRHRLKRYGYLT